ncbi:Oligo-1,6-glucosidase [compost metagenome]
MLAPEHDQIIAYTRTLGDQQMLVLANFSDRPARMVLPTHLVGGGRLLVPNYPRAATVEGQVELRPYEAFSLLR